MEWLEIFWATYSTLVLSVGTNVLLALSIYFTLSCGLLTVANAAFMGIGALHGRAPSVAPGNAICRRVAAGLTRWRLSSLC